MLPVIKSIHSIVEVTSKRALTVFTYSFIYLFNLFTYLAKSTVKEIV